MTDKVKLIAVVERCSGFSNRRLASLEVKEAPPHVVYFVTEGDVVETSRINEVMSELLTYGYDVEITARYEDVAPLLWIHDEELEDEHVSDS